MYKQTLRIILFLLYIIGVLFLVFLLKSWRLEQKRKDISSFEGKPFPALPLLNRSGEPAIVDFSSRPLTIVDFWFKDCPYCIAEMKQFAEVLRGKEKEIGIVSMSIDSREVWEDALSGKTSRVSFLADQVSSWDHYLLGAGEQENPRFIASRLNVTSYPSYFVVDNKGIIKATPASAVAYIRSGYNTGLSFVEFIQLRSTWTTLPVWLVLLGAGLYYFRFTGRLMTKMQNKSE